MRQNEFIYLHEGKEYPVIITYKRMKNIRYRYNEGVFYVSTNPYALKRDILKGLDHFFDRLVNRKEKPAPQGENFIYLLGERILLDESKQFIIPDGTNIIYKDDIDLEKKLKKWFLNFITQRVRYYQEKMNVPTYKVTIRKMSSRYGSNSKYTKTLHFATILWHYSIDIIDSVVVHELAHTLVYNHSKAFYDVVYKYFPNYDVCHMKLRKGIYQ